MAAVQRSDHPGRIVALFCLTVARLTVSPMRQLARLARGRSRTTTMKPPPPLRGCGSGPGFDLLDSRVLPSGAALGGEPQVRVFGADGTGLQDFFAFDQAFTGGVRVALGQAGSGPRVYAAGGAGMAPTIRGFDAGTGGQVFEQAAGDPAETGGVWVTAGDMNDDGAADLVTAANSGPDTELRMFDGASGLWLNRVTVDNPNYGVGILGWGGQRAVGLLGGSAMTAYTFGEGGDAPTQIGQGPASGWGGSGSSVGGWGASVSPYPETVATADTDWWPAIVPDQPDHIRLHETVTRVSAEECRWELKFTNTSVDSGNPESFYTRGAARFDLGFPDVEALNAVTRFETPAGWTASKVTGFGQGLRWVTGSDFVMPGQFRAFTFYTPPLTVTWSGGIVYTHNYLHSGEGPGQIPGDGPRIIITDSKGAVVTKDNPLKVAKWQDAFEMTADGKGVQVKGPDGNNRDFIDRDPDRFTVWVYDKTAWDAKTEGGDLGQPAHPGQGLDQAHVVLHGVQRRPDGGRSGPVHRG
jgi:hypothetical protein